MAVTLSSRELTKIAELQRTLLSGVDYPSVDDWMGDVVNAVVDLYGADAGVMTLPSDGESRARWSDDALNSAVPPYEEYYWQFDESLRRAHELPDPSVYHVTDLLTPAEISRDLVFAEWRAPNRLYDALGICLDIGEFIPLLLHAYRDRDDGRYRLREKKALAQLIAPSFHAGVQALLRLGRLREGMCALVYETGRVVEPASARRMSSCSWKTAGSRMRIGRPGSCGRPSQCSTRCTEKHGLSRCVPWSRRGLSIEQPDPCTGSSCIQPSLAGEWAGCLPWPSSSATSGRSFLPRRSWRLGSV